MTKNATPQSQVFYTINEETHKSCEGLLRWHAPSFPIPGPRPAENRPSRRENPPSNDCCVGSLQSQGQAPLSNYSPCEERSGTQKTVKSQSQFPLRVMQVACRVERRILTSTWPGHCRESRMCDRCPPISPLPCGPCQVGRRPDCRPSRLVHLRLCSQICRSPTARLTHNPCLHTAHRRQHRAQAAL